MFLKFKNWIVFFLLLFQINFVFSAPIQRTKQTVAKSPKLNQQNLRRSQTIKKNQPVKKNLNPSPKVIRPNSKEYGIYLGLFNYGKALPTDHCKLFFKFYINGEIKKYKIINSKNQFHKYVLHNRLQEGYLYEISFLGNTIVNLTFADNLNNFIEGTVTKILEDKIFINGKPYFYSENLSKKIICEAGGARIVNQKLSVGNFVNVLLKGNSIKILFINYKRKIYKPFIQGEPGVKTLKNYIKTALSAVGTILYVYGGGWNAAFSDGGSPQSTTIGVPRSCIDFFQCKTGKYSYQKFQTSKGTFIKNPQKSYFPYYGYNEYFYGGFDCSSYLAWVLYNILNTQSGKRSLNVSSTKVAKVYANWHYGFFTRKFCLPKNHKNSKFKPGNIISVLGHVWICLGTCKDGSILFLHSLPSWSIYGRYAGGGVQMSAIGKSKKCDAYRLADFYMKKYYSEWYKRYRPLLLSYEKYCNLRHQDAGMFQWNLNGSGLLKDPNNYVNKYPHEILRDIFRRK